MCQTEVHFGILIPLSLEEIGFESYEEYAKHLFDTDTTLEYDGTINYHTMFYNGGACFSEVIEYGLSNLMRNN